MIPSDYVAEIVALTIVSHPVLFLATHSEFSPSSRNGLYFNVDIFSIVASSKAFLITAYLLFICSLLYDKYFLVLGFPLPAALWFLFIRDRFRTLARGMGAPGYFNFFCVVTIYFRHLQANHANDPIGYISLIITLLLLCEFGAIFLSAGLFKFIDSRSQPAGFTFGLQNPTWSKIYRFSPLLAKARFFLDNLGPFLQVVAGFAVLFGTVIIKISGLLIISFMFLSIVPFCRLSWLCPAIAVNSFMFSTNIALYERINDTFPFYIFHILVALRLLCMYDLFSNYFKGKHPVKYFMPLLINAYKTLLGVIIWKVFTYDLVKYMFPCAHSQKIVQTEEYSDLMSAGEIDLSSFSQLSSLSNVYYAITLSSLLSSKDYLDSDVFNARCQKYMSVYNLSSIFYLQLMENNRESWRNLPAANPFACSRLRMIQCTEDLSGDIHATNRAINEQSLTSYITKKG